MHRLLLGIAYNLLMASFFTQTVLAADNRQELYIYFRGRLIYKAWYIAGQKHYGSVFHVGEGLSQEAKANDTEEGKRR
jgi:hypothetical protein